MKILNIKTVSPLLQKALIYLVESAETDDNSKKHALDLGCGEGKDTFFLADKGFTVTCIDKDEGKINQIRKTINSKIIPINGYIEDYDFPIDSFHIINAQYSLPFAQKMPIKELFHRITTSLQPHGIFCGQLFGIKDDWYGQKDNANFLKKNEVTALFKPYNSLYFSESTFQGKTLLAKTKMWHVYEFVISNSNVLQKNTWNV